MRYKGKIYKRIMLLGNSGSGKSWTAQRLGEKTGYPVIYLDKECWQPGWTYPPQEEWEKKNREYISGREWIIDGNHHETLEMRVEAADLILFFDINRLLCIYSVWKRHGHKISRIIWMKRRIRLFGSSWGGYGISRKNAGPVS